MHVEPAVSGAPGAAVLTRGGARVSQSHGISLTACRGILPGSAFTESSTVSLVPGSRTREGRPA